MGTRSAYLQPSGSVRAVFCHWDGCPVINFQYSTCTTTPQQSQGLSQAAQRDTWETYGNPVLEDDNGDYTVTGYFCKEGDREPQPLYHHERDQPAC